MAEAAAAFYTVETIVEGAAVGAVAVSQSTTPLHLRFRQLETPSSSPSWCATTAHSFHVIKGKAYIFGGDVNSGKSDNTIRVVTLPSDIVNGELDYQLINPEFESSRPLQQYTTTSTPHADLQGFEDVSISEDLNPKSRAQNMLPRAAHASSAIDDNIFVFTGRSPKSSSPTHVESLLADDQLFECDTIYSFSTQTNKWSILSADVPKCKDGIPSARTSAACSSTPHPQPDSAVDVTTHSHGTIFLHGGYNARGQPLRDTWAFDVSSKIWSQLPEMPDPLPEEVAGEGRIVCVEKRLWRVGDGFGKMMYLDFDVLRGAVVGNTSGPHPGETGVKPQSSKWEILSFGDRAADSALQGEIGAGSEKPLIDKTESLPVLRRGAGFVPVQVGAGRSFLLYFMGEDGPGSALNDVWSFQVKSESKTPAAVKDAVRNAIGKSTGENKWAPCDVVESTKEEGQVHGPRGLTGFAADSWKDLGGGNVVLWGGVDASGQQKAQCWIMSVE